MNKPNGLDSTPPLESHPGNVNFRMDMATTLIHVEVKRPLDILPTTVSISVFRFLELAAQVQAAVNQSVAVAVHGGGQVVAPSSRPF